MPPNNNSVNEDDVSEKFQVICEGLSAFKQHITILQQQIKNLEKDIQKKMKGYNKVIAKNQSKHAEKKQKISGFAKPSKISKELCEFMNKTEGTEMARTEVTKALVNYIKENNLENSSNKKVISPDEKLKFLLGVDKEEITYFNIQKYMNKHFITSAQ